MIQHSEKALVTITIPAFDAAGRPAEGATFTAELPCRTEPLTAEEQAALGNSTADLERVKLFATSWPAGITEVEVRGQKWHPVGPAKRHHSGSMTRRVVQILEAL